MPDSQLPPPGPPAGEQPQHNADPAPADQAPAPVGDGRDRAKELAELALTPDSLCGSFVHRIENGQIKWQGAIVARDMDAHDTYYLIELTPTSVEGATEPVQVLTTLARMVAKDEGYEWRLYNTREAMTSAYVDYELRDLNTTEPEEAEAE